MKVLLKYQQLTKDKAWVDTQIHRVQQEQTNLLLQDILAQLQKNETKVV